MLIILFCDLRHWIRNASRANCKHGQKEGDTIDDGTDEQGAL